MTIYILGTLEETAQALDDKSLDRMIKDIAQVLCNVHHHISADKFATWKNKQVWAIDKAKVPLKPKYTLTSEKWSQWARECAANYNYLVELGLTCIKQISERGLINKVVKYEEILWFARDNVPELPTQIYETDKHLGQVMKCGLLGNEHTPFPLVIPKKYLVNYLGYGNVEGLYSSIESYRNYYKNKYEKSFKAYHNISISDYVWTNRQKPEWLEL